MYVVHSKIIRLIIQMKNKIRNILRSTTQSVERSNL